PGEAGSFQLLIDSLSCAVPCIIKGGIPADSRIGGQVGQLTLTLVLAKQLNDTALNALEPVEGEGGHITKACVGCWRPRSYRACVENLLESRVIFEDSVHEVRSKPIRVQVAEVFVQPAEVSRGGIPNFQSAPVPEPFGHVPKRFMAFASSLMNVADNA